VILTLTTIVPMGLAGVIAGIYSLTQRHRTAAKVSAGLGLLTILLTIGVHGWYLAKAFEAVAHASPESKQVILAEAIAQAQWNLPIGAGLAMACVLLSGLSWWRFR